VIAGGGNLNKKFQGKGDFQFVNVLADVLAIQPSVRVHVTGLTTDKRDLTVLEGLSTAEQGTLVAVEALAQVHFHEDMYFYVQSYMCMCICIFVYV
jgi:hypothetical protein